MPRQVPRSGLHPHHVPPPLPPQFHRHPRSHPHVRPAASAAAHAPPPPAAYQHQHHGGHAPPPQHHGGHAPQHHAPVAHHGAYGSAPPPHAPQHAHQHQPYLNSARSLSNLADAAEASSGHHNHGQQHPPPQRKYSYDHGHPRQSHQGQGHGQQGGFPMPPNPTQQHHPAHQYPQQHEQQQRHYDRHVEQPPEIYQQHSYYEGRQPERRGDEKKDGRGEGEGHATQHGTHHETHRGTHLPPQKLQRIEQQQQQQQHYTTQQKTPQQHWGEKPQAHPKAATAADFQPAGSDRNCDSRSHGEARKVDRERNVDDQQHHFEPPPPDHRQRQDHPQNPNHQHRYPCNEHHGDSNDKQNPKGHSISKKPSWDQHGYTQQPPPYPPHYQQHQGYPPQHPQQHESYPTCHPQQHQYHQYPPRHHGQPQNPAQNGAHNEYYPHNQHPPPNSAPAPGPPGAHPRYHEYGPPPAEPNAHDAYHPPPTHHHEQHPNQPPWHHYDPAYHERPPPLPVAVDMGPDGYNPHGDPNNPHGPPGPPPPYPAEGGKSKSKNTSQNSSMAHYHLPKSDVLPCYKYSTKHKDKSWEEMLGMFLKFVEREGHGDVERDDPTMRYAYDKPKVRRAGGSSNNPDEANEETYGGNANEDGSTDVQLNTSSSNDAEEDEDALMLRSWVREVRWVIRAEGLGQDDNKFPQRSIKGASSSRPSGQVERCDSENVTPERLKELEDVPHFYGVLHGTDADGNSRPAFRRWLDDLMHYRAKHGGDCNVPLKYAEYPGLGNFVNRQRTEYRKLMQGKASSMTQTKIQELDRVDFVWSVREGGHASWESRLNELRDYRRLFGHTNVPKNYPPNPSLGYWVNEQRFQYRRLVKGKSSYMNPDKIARLDALNFKWSLRESKRPWHEWMDELRRYKEENGHCNVPLKYEKNVPLGSFVNNQRSEYRRYSGGKQSSMTEERVRELEGMGFLWSVRDGRTPWNVRLEELREYKRRFGNCDVPNSWPENQPLSSWVSKQRQLYKNSIRPAAWEQQGRKRAVSSQLTEERVRSLDELGFDWRHTTGGGAVGQKQGGGGGGGSVLTSAAGGDAQAVVVTAPAPIEV